MPVKSQTILTICKFCLTEAEMLCKRQAGEVMPISAREFSEVIKLLNVWYHKPYMGNIWLKSKSSSSCQILLVSISITFHVGFRVKEVNRY